MSDEKPSQHVTVGLAAARPNNIFSSSPDSKDTKCEEKLVAVCAERSCHHQNLNYTEPQKCLYNALPKTCKLPELQIRIIQQNWVSWEAIPSSNFENFWIDYHWWSLTKFGVKRLATRSVIGWCVEIILRSDLTFPASLSIDSSVPNILSPEKQSFYLPLLDGAWFCWLSVYSLGPVV